MFCHGAGGGGFLGGVCNKYVNLRKGFKQITKYGRGYEAKTSYFSKSFK